jgi:hypothetical protein
MIALMKVDLRAEDMYWLGDTATSKPTIRVPMGQ